MKHLLLLATLLVLFQACSTESDRSPQGQYERAMKQLDRFEFAQAESTFVRLQRADSVSPLGELGLAQTYERKLYWLDALRGYLYLLETHPDLAAAAGGATRCFYELGSYFDAAPAARKWVSLDAKPYQPYYWLTLTLIKIMDLSGASQALSQAEAAGLDHGTVKLIESRILWLGSSFDASMTAAAQGIRSATASPEYYCALAEYYVERGIPDSAVSAARQAYESQSSTFTASRYLDLCTRYHYFWAARQLLRSLEVREKEKAASNLLRLRYFWASEEKSPASTLADQLLESAPSAYTTLVYAGTTYRNSYHEMASTRNLESTVEIAGLTNQTESFKEYISAYVGYSFARSYNRGGAADRLIAVKGWRCQTTEFQAAIYAQMILGGGQTRAEIMLDTLLPIYGRNPVWLTAFGNAFSEAKGAPYDPGSKFYHMALEAAPSYRPAFCGLVAMAAAQRRHQDALATFDSFKQIGPLSPELAANKAVALVRTGRIDEGIGLFKQWFSQFPQDVESAWNLVLVLALKQRLDQINDLVSFTLEANRENPDAYELASRVALDQGKGAEGLQLARRGLEIEPDNLRLRVQEARGLYASGQAEESKRIFDDILARDILQGDANFYYSLILAESKSEPNRAENMAKRALVAVRPSLFPARNLARVYLALGMSELGRAAIDRAVQVEPSDPEVWYIQGMCQLMGGIPGAVESLQRAVTLGLSGDNLRKAQEAMQHL